MAIVLYHHPFTRAANTVWMLEEVGVDYTLHFLDIMKGEHKSPEILALNPMGKLPIITDGSVVVSESAAIGLYLADRYALGRLAPKPDDPARGTYLRWSLFAPSVIEPGSMAKASGWEYREGAAGWGNYQAMLAAMESAIAKGPFILGENFSMADVIFGGTLRYMVTFKIIEPSATFAAYIDRLNERPASKAANAKNAEVREAHGIKAS
ncbi:MAG: glutathione S-transferase family protein [Byssovorax sp.]